MHNARRGIRNVWRSKVRTLTVALLVGLAMCLAVTMMSIDSSIESQLASIAESVGTIIEVRPAGSYMGFGRGEPLDISLIEGMDSLAHVTAVEPVLMHQYVVGTSPGFGERSLEGIMRNRVFVVGVEAGRPLRLFGGGTAQLISGRGFEETDAGRLVAIVGKTYAEENGVVVGDLFEAGGWVFEAIGLSEAGYQLGDNAVFLPLATAQQVFGLEGQISMVYVSAESLSHVDTVVEALKAQVGDAADVVSQGDMLSRVGDSMDMVRGATKTGVWAALATSGLVIFFTMILVIRERQREIGVLKAIGSGNFDLLSGFAWEALALSVVGALVGILLFTTFGQGLAERFVSQSVTTAPGSGMSGGRAGWAVQGGILRAQLGTISASLSLNLVLRILGSAVGLGLLGGLLPALYALRLKPAEVLRND